MKAKHNYLKQALGLDAQIEKWQYQERLPFYLKEGKTFNQLIIKDKECLIVN